ncbi:MAG: hypothetical protein F4X64_01355 [Chloroflexi bacterium]|nr:hypothetical protein [Chloroflexota bacterium]
MTTTHDTGQTEAENRAGESYEVMVSRYDAADFDGDWRYSAFCPDIDAAMDGRTPEEAVLRVTEAIRVKLADCHNGQFPLLSPEARAEAIADFMSDGRLVAKTTVTLERE